MARLQRLHAAAGHLAEEAPELIANPDAARGPEQALIEAMIGCLGKGEVREDSVAQRQHELIMRRFRRVVEEIPRSRSTCRKSVPDRTRPDPLGALSRGRYRRREWAEKGDSDDCRVLQEKRFFAERGRGLGSTRRERVSSSRPAT